MSVIRVKREDVPARRKARKEQVENAQLYKMTSKRNKRGPSTDQIMRRNGKHTRAIV